MSCLNTRLLLLCLFMFRLLGLVTVFVRWPLFRARSTRDLITFNADDNVIFTANPVFFFIADSYMLTFWPLGDKL